MASQPVVLLVNASSPLKSLAGNGTVGHLAGEINVPVSCAGLAVIPGDLIVGDADGVIAVPAAEAADVLERCRAHLRKEAKIRADNAAGTSDPERFDAMLRAKGLPI